MRLREFNPGTSLTADELAYDIVGPWQGNDIKDVPLVIKIGNKNYRVSSFDFVQSEGKLYYVIKGAK